MSVHGDAMFLLSLVTLLVCIPLHVAMLNSGFPFLIDLFSTLWFMQTWRA